VSLVTQIKDLLELLLEILVQINKKIK